MALMETPQADLGWKAPNFEGLKGVDGKLYSLDDVKGKNGLLVMFICNHCPYVLAIVERLVADMKVLQQAGVGVVAIMSNDVEAYPDDSFANMQKFADKNGFTFPYIIDETQEIARKYDAICTPDFFGFNKDLELVYRGRLDSAGHGKRVENTKLELLDAMQSTDIQLPQYPSMGCSIKWK